MRISSLSKPLSIFISAALVGTSLPISARATVPSAATPDFIKTLTPPETLGYVDSFYQGNTDHPVILIQDLHANYGVQKKIVGLLDFYSPVLTAAGHKMVLGIEGAWGKMDMTKTRQVAEKPRRAASEFLLKQAEITGMGYFAAMTEAPVDFYGIDNPADYLMHRELLRKSLAARLELATKIDQLRQAVNVAKTDGDSASRRMWKLIDDFHSGRLALGELSQKLNRPLANYGEAEAALAQAQNDIVNQQKGDKAFYLKNVVVADRDLELLARLLRQQLTLEEVQYASKNIPGMLKVIQMMLPGENMQLWQDAVRAAIDHYAIALVRNKPMAEHAKELAEKYPNDSPIIVAGGFHTAGIADELKLKKISYVVISPIVPSHTSADERLYLKRIMGLHLTREQIATAALSYARSSTFLRTDGLVARWMNDSGVEGAEAVQSDAIPSDTALSMFANGVPADTVARTVAVNDEATERFIDAGVPAEKKNGLLTSVLNRITMKIRSLPFFGGTTAAADQAASVTVDKTARNVVDVKPTQSLLSRSAAMRKSPLIGGGAIVAALAITNIAGHAMTTVAQVPQASSAWNYAAGAALGVGALGMAWYKSKTGPKQESLMDRARRLGPLTAA